MDFTQTNLHRKTGINESVAPHIAFLDNFIANAKISNIPEGDIQRLGAIKLILQDIGTIVKIDAEKDEFVERLAYENGLKPEFITRRIKFGVGVKPPDSFDFPNGRGYLHEAFTKWYSSEDDGKTVAFYRIYRRVIT